MDKQEEKLLNGNVALATGWTHLGADAWAHPQYHYVHTGPPPFCTTNPMAWELVEKFGLTVGPLPDGPGRGGWYAGLELPQNEWKVWCPAQTIPEAVARAVVALHAVVGESL